MRQAIMKLRDLVTCDMNMPAIAQGRRSRTEERVDRVADAVKPQIVQAGFTVDGVVRSPIKGAKGNVELLALLRPRKLD